VLFASVYINTVLSVDLHLEYFTDFMTNVFCCAVVSQKVRQSSDIFNVRTFFSPFSFTYLVLFCFGSNMLVKISIIEFRSAGSFVNTGIFSLLFYGDSYLKQ
jgi:hypothetical protein